MGVAKETALAVNGAPMLAQVEIDPRLLMAAKAIQIMGGVDEKTGAYKINDDLAFAAAVYQAGTGQLVGRDFYVNDKVGRMEGYRGAARDAADRGAGEMMHTYRDLTPDEMREHEVEPGDIAVACEVTQLRAIAQAQKYGIRYQPIIGIGIYRELEMYDKGSTTIWKESSSGKRYPAGQKPRSEWRKIALEGGMTWRKKAQNRAYKDALRHVPGAPASPDEVIEQGALDYGIELPPETARLSMDQAHAWVEGKVASQKSKAEWDALTDDERHAASTAMIEHGKLQKEFNEWVFDDRPCPHCGSGRNEKHFEDCAFRSISPKMPTRPRPTETEKVTEGQFRPLPGNGHAPETKPAAQTQPAARPMAPEKLRDALKRRATGPVTIADPQKITAAGMMCLREMFGGEENQRAAIRYIYGHEHRSAVTPPEFWALNQWRDARKNNDGEWIPNGFAIEEARLLIEHLTEQNQIAEPASLFDDADDGDPLAEVEGAED